MLNRVIPEKLKKGDTIRIITPARSMGLISQTAKNTANQNLEEMGLKITFGKHVDEMDEFVSSSVESRVEDLHDAFRDKNVKAIVTVIGGFNSNQLLFYLDWELISKNPKILCGFSDITALSNAIFAKTKILGYSGPHYVTFGQPNYLEYTTKYFKKCLFSNEPFEVESSPYFLDDEWWKGFPRVVQKNHGWWIINEGTTSGIILGANLCTFNLLQGTEYFPEFDDSILFLEDDYESAAHHFDRDLQSLIHLPRFKKVKGIVIGRFQNKSNVDKSLLTKLIRTKKELNNLPVIANVDFGHTEPKISFPIGGTAEITVKKESSTIKIISH